MLLVMLPSLLRPEGAGAPLPADHMIWKAHEPVKWPHDKDVFLSLLKGMTPLSEKLLDELPFLQAVPMYYVRFQALEI